MDSILSTGERRVASLLAAGNDIEAIAEARGQSVETTERTVERIREKTTRALTTLLESPFTDEMAAELTDEQRDAIRAQL